jgi:hypothetical protein
MANMLPILLWLVIGIISAGAGIILIVGLRNVIWGKIEMISLVSVIAVIAVAVILSVVLGPAEGLITAALVMLFVTILALMLSGVRGLFS